MSPRKKSGRGRGVIDSSFDLTYLLEESQLPVNLLPSNGDIIRHSRYVRGKLYKSAPNEVIAKDVSEEVYGFWSSKVAPYLPSSVILSSKACYNKTLKLLDKANVLKKNGNSAAIQRIVEESKDLFDLFHCRFVKAFYKGEWKRLQGVSEKCSFSRWANFSKKNIFFWDTLYMFLNWWATNQERCKSHLKIVYVKNENAFLSFIIFNNICFQKLWRGSK